MFLKFTRMDGTPIWINGSYIVTVEPRRLGGSIVVPIGDGLDYDVREEPDTVLAMLGEVPAPTVVPVPSNAALAPTPADMSAEMGRVQNFVELPSSSDASDASTVPQPEPTDIFPALDTKNQAPSTTDEAEKPKKKTRAKRKTKAAAAEEQPAEAAATETPQPAVEPETPPPPVVFEAEVEVPAKKKRRVKKPPLLLDDEQLERLRKMAPRTVKKLKNTLNSQFVTPDVDETVVAMEAHGVITIGANEHILWMK